VLVVIAALSLAALGYSEWMLVERQAVDVAGRQIQARALAESGVELARAMLSADAESQEESGGWHDNATRFQGVVVLDEEQDRARGRFSVVAPGDEEGGVRFGLENESGKINLNTLVALDKASENAGRTMLMALPDMTEEIADAILDWLDSDDEARESGAESEYYATLDPPYTPKNGPLGSIEELLLVRGVTPQLLFGTDAQRTGLTTSSGSTWTTDFTGSSDSTEDATGSSDSSGRGWASYLTLYSRETNLASDGEAKINVNDSDLQTLYDKLTEAIGEAYATYIVAYRLQSSAYQAKDSDSSLKVETTPSGQLDLTASGQLTLKTVLDLIGQRVRVKYQGQQSEVILESPFANEQEAMRTYLPILMDKLTTNAASKAISGRINLHYAPQEVIAAIPGMTSEIAEQIVAQRDEAQDSSEVQFQHATWLLTEGIVTLDQMKALLPYVTAGGDVYRCQVVGYYDKDGPCARIEAMLDATKRPAAVLFWKDLSRLGRGYSLETLSGESSAAETESSSTVTSTP
jgi:type II secretory pathway component PulK